MWHNVDVFGIFDAVPGLESVPDAIKLYKLFGIQIFFAPAGLSKCILLVLVMTAVLHIMRRNYMPSVVVLLWGCITAILLHAASLLHELAHCVALQMNGITVDYIVMHSAVKMLTHASTSADVTLRAEAIISMAGPFVDLMLCIIFVIIRARMPIRSNIYNVLTILSLLTFALFVGNLVPVTNLDGTGVFAYLYSIY